MDDITDKTVAMNPELMKYLEKLMVESRYDLKAFLRVLYNTTAYQRSVSREEMIAGKAFHFTGPVLRRMSAEQIWDSFVTLIHPPPDLPRRFCDDPEIAANIAQRRKMSDALDSLSAQELFEGAAKASKSYESVSARANELKVEYAAAQEAQDKQKMEKLAAEINALNMKARSSANDLLVMPAIDRLYTKVTGAPPPEHRVASAAAEQPAMMMGGKGYEPNTSRSPDMICPTKTPAEKPDEAQALREEARTPWPAGIRVGRLRRRRGTSSVANGCVPRTSAPPRRADTSCASSARAIVR